MNRNDVLLIMSVLAAASVGLFCGYYGGRSEERAIWESKSPTVVTEYRYIEAAPPTVPAVPGFHSSLNSDEEFIRSVMGSVNSANITIDYDKGTGSSGVLIIRFGDRVSGDGVK